MRNWVWKIAFVALGGIFAACTADSDSVAGSSLETENSVAVALTVQREGGAPAARSKVLVRPSEFLAGANTLAITKDINELDSDSPVVAADSAQGILNLETDEQGHLNLPRLKPGTYMIEARQEAERAVSRVVVTDSSLDSVSMTVMTAGSMTGKVYLPTGEKSVTVSIQGLDYFVETDSLGNFEFENLPEGSFRVVGFVFNTYESVGPDGETETFSSYLPVGISSANVKSETTVENVTIGQRPINIGPAPSDSSNDTTVTDTADIYPVVFFEDFEDSTNGWYKTVSRYGVVHALDAQFDKVREGLVAHFEYQNDSNYNWVLMGRSLNAVVDFSDLDSVVFWARSGLSDSAQWISFSFDVLLDSAELEKNGYENGKAWVHLSLDTTWQRYVVTPDDLLETDSTKNGGNIGWENVKDHVTNLNLFGGGIGGPYEMWVDDITIYGVKGIDP
ncbi:hypothetical protein [uncultured Fibrobacter sp.]|uniref:hypothetical protein n=1 Tax=uncultured Fibrobacter sp. TaxID=261512 RepID=UPI002635B3FB|nr:hypothetical protein [uncultured Fibrobacter sp.]